MNRAGRWWVAAGVVVVLVAVALVAGRYLWLPQWRPELRAGERYAIDVSAHQGAIDWAEVRADDVDLVYVKATEGRDFVDDRFRTSTADARRAGLTTGAYHFFTLCSPGREQAEHFVQTVGDPSGLPPAVDLELAGNCAGRPPQADVDRELADFLAVAEQWAGTHLVLYVGEDWRARYGLPPGAERPLWVRHLFRRPAAGWAVWQVSGYARVEGIAGDVDLDVVAPGAGPR